MTWNGPRHSISYKTTCPLSNDSDQPGQMRSLIRVIILRWLAKISEILLAGLTFIKFLATPLNKILRIFNSFWNKKNPKKQTKKKKKKKKNKPKKKKKKKKKKNTHTQTLPIETNHNKGKQTQGWFQYFQAVNFHWDAELGEKAIHWQRRSRSPCNFSKSDQGHRCSVIETINAVGYIDEKRTIGSDSADARIWSKPSLFAYCIRDLLPCCELY